MNRFAAFALTCSITTASMAAPSVSGYFTPLPPRVIDSSFSTSYRSSDVVTADLNGDGHQDLIMLGADYPQIGVTSYAPRPGRVYWGNGQGGFTAATESQFPLSTLNTVHPRKVLTADLNGDGRLDVFVANHGWDTEPFPGEQNRLYLSQPDGTWRDATASLPQLSDYTHTAAIGDVDGDGRPDIYVGNMQGRTGILPYMLMNQGNGQFTLDRSRLPVGEGEGLHAPSGHRSPGANLADLDGDGAPDLIVTADTGGLTKHTTVYWNRAGRFSDADKTLLPENAMFAGNHIDLDAQAIDVNGDGRPDIVLAGTQYAPFYEGWFVQILINQGDRSFIDETASRLPPATMSGGTRNPDTTPWPVWIRGLDFNGDGFPDFAVDLVRTLKIKQTQPIVWLNDGTGHFTTLNAGDFVNAGNEWQLGATHLMATANGYSFITPQTFPGSGGLVMTGLIASAPYRITPPSTNRPASVAECLFNWGAATYPTFFAGPATDGVLAEYTYRHFSGANVFLALSGKNNHFYYLGPLSNSAILDLGGQRDWLMASNCR